MKDPEWLVWPHERNFPIFCLVDPNSNNHFTEKRCHWLLSHTILRFKLIVDLENSFKNKYLFYFSFLMILLHRPPNNEFYCVSFRTRSVTKQTWPFLRYLYCVFTSPQIITHSMCFYCSHHLMQLSIERFLRSFRSFSSRKQDSCLTILYNHAI